MKHCLAFTVLFFFSFFLSPDFSFAQTSQQPYNGVPWPIPGTIQAEHFDTGGEGVSYHDTDTPNTGASDSNFRTSEGVDITITDDGSGSPFHVSDARTGEWLEYTVDVKTTGTYRLVLRAAAVYGVSGGKVHLEVDGVNKSGSISIEAGPWLGYKTTYVPNISLTAGSHIVRLVMDANTGNGFSGEFNWFTFELTSPVITEPPVTIPLPSSNRLYVSPTGNDANPGTEQLPWKTITKAANTATAGQTVFIRAGTYKEQLIPKNSGTANNYIIFSAYPGETVTLDASGIVIPRLEGIVNIKSKSYIRVTGLRLINAGANVTDGFWMKGIAVQYSDHIVLDDNYISHIYSHGIAVQSFSHHVLIDGNEITDTNFGSRDTEVSLGILWFSYDVEVRNNYLHHSAGEGIDPVAGAWNVIVHHNTIHDMGRQGFYVDSWTEYQHDITFYNNLAYNNGVVNGNGGFAISSEEGGTLERVTFYNNISHNNRGAGFAVTSWGSNTHRIKDVTIINNTIYKNGQPGILVNNSEASGIILRNNISYLNAGSNIAIDSSAPGGVVQSNNLTSNPQFVNAAANNFRLQSSSPAINAGSPLLAPSTDYDGNARPFGSGYDIGAYEYGSVSTPTPVASSTPSPSPTSIASTSTPTPTPQPSSPTPTPKPGDLDGNGSVGLGDLTILLSNFGKTGQNRGQGDLDGNGNVTLGDLTILLSNYGR